MINFKKSHLQDYIHLINPRSMGKKVLGILFLVGLGLAGITTVLIFSGTTQFMIKNMVIIILTGAIGFSLMMLSGIKLLKRFNRYLDRD
jgi:uncharacterized membrane protein SirB2